MMILSPLLGVQIRPKLCSWINQTRNIRPIIKLSKEQFQLCLDVRQFKKEEICVKARPEYVIIEGKQELKTKQGYTIRQFVRKYKLPDGCNPQCMKSQLSPEGILTITAPREVIDINLPCETVVPISHSGPKKDCGGAMITIETPKPDENKKQ